MSLIPLNNFTSGEIAPEHYGRIDLPAYANSCKTLKNFFVGELGSIKRRPPINEIGGLDHIIPFDNHTTPFDIVELKELNKILIITNDRTTLLDKNFNMLANTTLLTKSMPYQQMGDDIYFINNGELRRLYITNPGVGSYIFNQETLNTGKEVKTISLDSDSKTTEFIERNTLIFFNDKREYDYINPLASTTGYSDRKGQGDYVDSITIGSGKGHVAKQFIARAITDIPVGTQLVIRANLIDVDAPTQYIRDKYTLAGSYKKTEALTYINAIDTEMNLAWISSVPKDQLPQWGKFSSMLEFEIFSEFKYPETASGTVSYYFRINDEYKYFDTLDYMRIEDETGTPLTGATLSYYYQNQGTPSEKAYVKATFDSGSIRIKENYSVRFSAIINQLENQYTPEDKLFEYQNRLVITSKNKISFSAVGDYSSFITTETPDSAISFELKRKENIMIVSDQPYPVIITDESEYSIQSRGVALSPTDLFLQRKSNYGSTGVYNNPQNAITYMSRNRLNQYIYDYQTNNFYSFDLSIMSKHLFEKGIKQIKSISNPQKFLFFLTEDNKLFMCSYDSSLNLKAFANIEFESEAFELVDINTFDDKLYIHYKNGPDYFIGYFDFESDTFIDCVSDISAALDSSLNGNRIWYKPTSGNWSLITYGGESLSGEWGRYFESHIITSNLVIPADSSLTQGRIKRIVSALVRIYNCHDFKIKQEDENEYKSAFLSGSILDESFSGDINVTIGGSFDKNGRIDILADTNNQVFITGIYVDVLLIGEI